MKTLAFKSSRVLLLSVVLFLATSLRAQEYYEPELLLVSQPTINYYYDSDGSLNAYIYFDLENIGSYDYKGRFYLYLDPSAFWLEKVSRYIKVKPGHIKRVTMTIPVYNLNYGVDYSIIPMYKYNDELYPLSMYEDFEMLTITKIPNYSYAYIVRTSPNHVTYYHFDCRYERPGHFMFDSNDRIIWHNDTYYYHGRYGYVPPRYHHDNHHHDNHHHDNHHHDGYHHDEPNNHNEPINHDGSNHDGDNHGGTSGSNERDGLHVVGGNHSTPMSNKGVNTSNTSSSISVTKPNNGSTGISNNGSNNSSSRNKNSNVSSSSSSSSSSRGSGTSSSTRTNARKSSSSSSSRGSATTSSSSSKPRSSATTNSSSSSRSSKSSGTISSSSSSKSSSRPSSSSNSSSSSSSSSSRSSSSSSSSRR